MPVGDAGSQKEMAELDSNGLFVDGTPVSAVGSIVTPRNEELLAPTISMLGRNSKPNRNRVLSTP